MSARPSRFLVGAGTAALALALGGGPVLAMMPGAAAAPAKGSLTVHAVGTSIEDENNEPHVCAFTLVADNYASTVASIDYTIVKQAPSSPVGEVVASGSIALAAGVDGDNEGQSVVINLADGHYKPQGQWVDGDSGENGADNFKAFWVECEDTGGGTTGGTTGETTGGTTTGGTTTGGTTTGGTTTGGTTTGGTTTGGTTGETTTGGTTGETTTGGSTGETTTGGTTGEATTTGAATGGDFTGGGGTVLVPVAAPVGGGTVTTANELPRTGRNAGVLAAWGLAAIVAGFGFLTAGQRRGKHAR